MRDFMIKIGYTLLNTKAEYLGFLAEVGYYDFVAREYSKFDFPMYMKPVFTDDNGYGQTILNFATVKPETLK